MQKKNIVIFDSGVGGLDVFYRCVKNLEANFVYINDKSNMPYGSKKPSEITKLAVSRIDEIAQEMRVDLLVIACNTLSAIASDVLRREYSFPIVTMEPAIKPALKSNAQHIVLLATPNTIKHSAFVSEMLKNPRIKAVGLPRLAQLVENEATSDKIKKYLLKSISKEILQECDSVVLGCSHYGHVVKEIKSVFKNDVTVFNNDEMVFQQIKSVLASLY